MSCFHPIEAYKIIGEVTANDKAVIVFKKPDKPYTTIKVPCSSCIGCRVARSREWALRCVHEASLHNDNCFITLTFNDDNLDNVGSLEKSDFQKFMKRFRKRFPDKRIRFFHCGEYGSHLMRPHHHAAIFGFDFPDRQLWQIRDGIKLYRSAILEELWPFGFCTVGDVTYESAAYIARYCTKKITGKKSKLHYMRVDDTTGECHELLPEYITMSRRPGLAREWIEKNTSDVYPKDFVTHKGRKFKPPKYYDRIYDVQYPDTFLKIKKIRLTKAISNPDNSTIERLKAREVCAKARLKTLKRGFEQ